MKNVSCETPTQLLSQGLMELSRNDRKSELTRIKQTICHSILFIPKIKFHQSLECFILFGQ